MKTKLSNCFTLVIDRSLSKGRWRLNSVSFRQCAPLDGRNGVNGDATRSGVNAIAAGSGYALVLTVPIHNIISRVSIAWRSSGVRWLRVDSREKSIHTILTMLTVVQRGKASMQPSLLVHTPTRGNSDICSGNIWSRQGSKIGPETAQK